MAARAGTGIELDLTLVPQREQGMTAYEMLLSESQERMLIVAHSGREREVMDIFRKWDLDAVVIGRVRDSSRMQVLHNGVTVADIPVSALTDEAPLYNRPMTPPSPKANNLEPRRSSNYKAPNSKPDRLIATASCIPQLRSKQWVYRQYDHMSVPTPRFFRERMRPLCGLKETRRAGDDADGNGRYCAANPREGAKLIVAESARNVVCVGARPVAITNCLNFASPERAEVMWSFSEVIDGMAEACKVFNTPVVSGNVSFYNETEGRGILPTPVIGMIGLIMDVRRAIQQGFKNEGEVIALLGTTADDMSLGEYTRSIVGVSTTEMIGQGKIPHIDLASPQFNRHVSKRLKRDCFARSMTVAMEVSVALAESCFRPWRVTESERKLTCRPRSRPRPCF